MVPYYPDEWSKLEYPHVCPKHDGYKNLSIVWERASRASDKMSDWDVSKFLKGEKDTYRTADGVMHISEWDRGELRDIDDNLSELEEKLTGVLLDEVKRARLDLFDKYGNAYEDDPEYYGDWDGVTAPADILDIDGD